MDRRSYKPISLVFVVFVALVFFVAGFSAGGPRAAMAQATPSPMLTGGDGNPVGFDILPTAPSTTVLQTSSDTCLSNTSAPCNSIEVHYLAQSPPTCPSDYATQLACTANNPRALPTCQTGEQCFLLPALPAKVYSQSDDGTVHPETTTAQVLIVLKHQ